jgi:hypothetical protein
MHAATSVPVTTPGIWQNEANRDIWQNEANSDWPNEANAKTFALQTPPGILAERSQWRRSPRPPQSSRIAAS